MLTAVPYCLWDNRAPGDLTVWIPESAEVASLAGEPLTERVADRTVRGSHCWTPDSLAALCDGKEPNSSGDHSIPRHTFWNHRGTEEWLQYEWESARTISTAAVYWFDDTGRGSCRVPARWHLEWRDGEQWKEVNVTEGSYGVDRDRTNEVGFTAVRTKALRLVIELQKEVSAGVLEWEVDAEE